MECWQSADFSRSWNFIVGIFIYAPLHYLYNVACRNYEFYRSLILNFFASYSTAAIVWDRFSVFCYQKLMAIFHHY